MKKMYKSEPLMVIHEMACDLYEIGAIDEARMREYDADCLLPAPQPRANTEADMTAPPRTLRDGSSGRESLTTV